MELPFTVDAVSNICCKVVKNVLESSTKKQIKYSSTILKVPRISLRPEMGCFVQFTGDYNGLAVMNFSANAAMEIYRSYMVAMGIDEKELAKEYTSSEVPDSIGEIVNQIMGQLMRMVESKLDLRAFCGQPKALSLNNSIILTIDSEFNEENRRLSFTISGHRFYVELAMESSTLIPMKQ
ncbi:MAG: DUF3334 family protein [Desulfobacterales bacterium]|nr:DUF3334 family protein [Desulfobacterales bacterium]